MHSWEKHITVVDGRSASIAPSWPVSMGGRIIVIPIVHAVKISSILCHTRVPFKDMDYWVRDVEAVSVGPLGSCGRPGSEAFFRSGHHTTLFPPSSSSPCRGLLIIKSLLALRPGVLS